MKQIPPNIQYSDIQKLRKSINSDSHYDRQVKLVKPSNI